MQVRKPDAPIRANAPMPLKKAPEHRPIADSSRLTGTWRKRESTANCRISGVIQPSGRLATSEMPHSAAASAMWTATAPLSFINRARSTHTNRMLHHNGIVWFVKAHGKGNGTMAAVEEFKAGGYR